MLQMKHVALLLLVEVVGVCIVCCISARDVKLKQSSHPSYKSYILKIVLYCPIF